MSVQSVVGFACYGLTAGLSFDACSVPGTRGLQGMKALLCISFGRRFYPQTGDDRVRLAALYMWCEPHEDVFNSKVQMLPSTM